jgi:hypothetical protein
MPTPETTALQYRGILLAAYRAGDEAAGQQLVESLLPLAAGYSRRLAHLIIPPATAEDLYSQLCLDLCQVVNRLRANSVDASGILRVVRQHLRHSAAHMLAVTTSDVLPTRAAKRDQHKAIKRVRGRKHVRVDHDAQSERRDADISRDPYYAGDYEPDHDSYISPLEDPEADRFRDTSRARQERPEDRLDKQEEREAAMTICQQLPRFAKTEFEAKVAGLLAAGYGLPDIQASMPDTPEINILDAVRRLSARARGE